MPEGAQSRVPRTSRAERMITSCSECRRRKQKCNQGQPCSNCARRFPQPICEYRVTSSRRPTTPATPQQPTTLAPPHQTTSFANDYAPPIPGTTRPLLPLSSSALFSVPGFSGRQEVCRDQRLLCEEHCNVHSDAIHDSAKLLYVFRSIPERFAGSNTPNTPLMAFDVAFQSTAPWSDDANFLGMFVRLISQFNASLDGFPDSSNLYIKHYVPYCLQTPLLAQGAIHTAACLLGETGHIDRMVAISHKGKAIALLNDHLRLQPSTSDEAVAGVVQLITDEFYWGDAEYLHPHLCGLREMIRMRGGFRHIGLHGLISKLAISSDVAISLTSGAAPFLRGEPEFEFKENSVPLRLSLNTPFVSPLVPFTTCAEALKLHPGTASVLDDMRFLISTVLKLPKIPSSTEIQKVHTTSAWIHDRIGRLPSELPTATRRNSFVLSPDPSSAVTLLRTSLPIMSQSHDEAASRPQHAGDYVEDEENTESGGIPAGIKAWQRTTLAESNREPPDYLYEAVRATALLYSRAVMLRRPFGSIMNEDEFLELWTTVWYVSLAKWKSVLGIFHWIMVALVSCACNTPHSRLVKSMLTTSMLQIGLENWEVASGAMESAVRLQRWLRGEPNESAGSLGEVLSPNSAENTKVGSGTREDAGGSRSATRVDDRVGGKGKDRESCLF